MFEFQLTIPVKQEPDEAITQQLGEAIDVFLKVIEGLTGTQAEITCRYVSKIEQWN